MRRKNRTPRVQLAAGLLLAAVLAAPALPALAQPMMGGGSPGGGGGMPDLRVINGKPLPDTGLAAGTVTVRVARKMPVNAVAGVEVSAIIKNSGGDLKKRTATTDSSGRAVFEGVGAGQQFQATVIVDGETVKTTDFQMPAQGGVRTMLIAGLGPAPAGGDGQAAGEPGAAGSAGGGDNFSIGVSSGTVEPVASLPDKTLEVRLFDQKGHPIAGQPVLLGMVAQGTGGLKILRATTSREGIAKFQGLAIGSGTGYAAVIDYDGMRLGTPPFVMPEEGGARAEIHALERTSDQSVIRIGSGGRIILQMHEDVLQVLEMLPIENLSRKLFDPGVGGIEIPLPKGFVNAEPADGEKKLEVRQNYGVAVHGTVAPKVNLGPDAAGNPKTTGAEVTFGFVVPYHGSSHEFAQRMPNGIGATTLITEQVTDLTIEGPGLGARQARELGGRKYWVMPLEGVAPGAILSFTINGLPSTDNSGRIAAGVLALLLVAAAVVFGRRPAGKRKAAGGERDKLLQRREALFADLLIAEQERQSARQSPQPSAQQSDGKERRGQLVAKLEAVYRDLAALDEQRAQ